MSNKELIIALIQQDLKHSQLVLGLDALGLEASDKHCLEILDIVFNLMQVPDGEIEYDSLRGCCAVVPIVCDVHARMQSGWRDTHTTEAMKPFAEACYNGLVDIINPKIWDQKAFRPLSIR